MAALTDEDGRRRAAPLAQSAALLATLLLAVVVAAAASITSGLTQLALTGAALGLPAVMLVESSYWRRVFLDGARPAGVHLAVAYAGQAVLVAAAAPWLPSRWVVLAPFAALLLVALTGLLLMRDRKLSWSGAREWWGPRRGSWWPYVVGVSAGVALVQSIPVVLSATAGYTATSVYRAGELAFGGTNLLIGVASQTLLTQGSSAPRRAYSRGAALGAAVAGLNGLVLALAPEGLLRVFLGPVTPLVLEILPLMTTQRAALAVSSIGAMLLIPLLSAHRIGVLDVIAAGLALSMLVVGGLVDGLDGAVAGLAAAEVLLAVTYVVLLRRAT
ncbi:hypothetical protein [Kineococcus aurantiacus]|uniref:O-antigen/teichoic acid export membrane protein n=2 Tax=Kineococcus aurantiacus TaxID=37633 RepID=A0A7Y9DPP4_9ACTN|nr:hypothetical protein [Kineococcus aurantiacus]NYD24434.1 hypothetical protein [Kineococcus aurantiacus]